MWSERPRRLARIRLGTFRIAKREQQETLASMRIQSAVQLDLPMVVGEPVPILYVQMRLRTQAWTEQEYP